MFRNCALMAASFLSLLSCRPIPIDVSHAATDKGYLNSGLRSLGQLYLLDVADGDLKELAILDLSNRVSGAVFEEQIARDVRGVEIGGDLSVGVEARVRADISRHSYIRLTNAFDESYKNTFGDLSAEINAREAEGQDLGFEWFLDEAIQEGSSIRYLLVYSTIRADEAVIGYENVTAVDGQLNVPLRGRSEVTAEISGLSDESFKGKSVPVLVDYHVIEAFQGSDGNYKFRLDLDFDDDDLIEILKGRMVAPEEEAELVTRAAN